MKITTQELTGTDAIAAVADNRVQLINTLTGKSRVQHGAYETMKNGRVVHITRSTRKVNLDPVEGPWVKLFGRKRPVVVIRKTYEHGDRTFFRHHFEAR